ncbi:alternative sulfate transporter [Fusarium globosum]|uniref:Alternative sulfate transporter n=1 Tax=Fusarium globosum TaxID=78864 RepID=A0A8H5XWL3_9HYPO|nr:alternative sulfate transporter [Fusarium globosum]
MVQEASSAEKSPSDAFISRAELPSPQLPDPHKHENSSFESSWTESEEKALVRNGNALTDNFLHDVGISQNWFNVGQQLLNAGIVLLEVSSPAFDCPLASALGAVDLFAYLLESGFIPGSLYTLSAWYKNSELSRRFGFFFLGNGIAQACGGLLAYGVLHMRGVAGLAGWQWLFILEADISRAYTFFPPDKTGRRGFVVLFGVFCQWIFMVAFRALPDSSSAGLKFGIVTMGTATCSWWHSVNGSWLSINASCPEKRAIRMAMFIMAANCAGIVGGQLFRSDDLPYYHRGWTIIAVLMSIALSAVISLLIIYWQANRQLASGSNVTDQSADDYGHHENGLQRRNRSAASPYNY